MPVRKDAPVYQLKITLCEITPPIWRRFQVRGDLTLYKLHGVLQVVMGWTGSHLYGFEIGRAEYGSPDGPSGHLVEDDRRARLQKVAAAEGATFTYKYDFGDGWEHDVVVEKIGAAEPDVRYPVCLAGARACPPEDCGGPPGYDSLIEAIVNPNLPDADEILEWVGGKFDPEAFDLEEINRRIRELR